MKNLGKYPENKYPKRCSENGNKSFHTFNYWDESGHWHCKCGADHNPDPKYIGENILPPVDQRFQQFKWISVEDHLPDITEWVFTISSRGRVKCMYYVMTYVKDIGFVACNGIEYFNDIDTDDIVTVSDITHWAHIPEIPEIPKKKKK